MNKWLRFGATVILAVSTFAFSVQAATTTQSTSNGTTVLRVQAGVKITNATSTDFGDWTTNKLGEFIYNVDPVRLRIQDERDTGKGDWTISARTDEISGSNGQTCPLPDFQLDGSKATIKRQINGGEYQNVTDATVKTGKYAARRDNREWTPILSVRGLNHTKANYEVVWAPQTIAIKLCNKLQPADYQIVTHWMITDGIS